MIRSSCSWVMAATLAAIVVAVVEVVTQVLTTCPTFSSLRSFPSLILERPLRAPGPDGILRH